MLADSLRQTKAQCRTVHSVSLLLTSADFLLLFAQREVWFGCQPCSASQALPAVFISVTWCYFCATATQAVERTLKNPDLVLDWVCINSHVDRRG